MSSLFPVLWVSLSLSPLSLFSLSCQTQAKQGEGKGRAPSEYECRSTEKCYEKKMKFACSIDVRLTMFRVRSMMLFHRRLHLGSVCMRPQTRIFRKPFKDGSHVCLAQTNQSTQGKCFVIHLGSVCMQPQTRIFHEPCKDGSHLCLAQTNQSTKYYTKFLKRGKESF